MHILVTRIAGMEAWLAEPNLMQADSDAEYHTIININMDHIKVWLHLNLTVCSQCTRLLVQVKTSQHGPHQGVITSNTSILHPNHTPNVPMIHPYHAPTTTRIDPEHTPFTPKTQP